MTRDDGYRQDTDDLAFARFLADAADQRSLDLYRSGELLVASKPDTNEVTQANLAVDDHLRHLIGTHRPEQGVLGEERGPPAASGSAGSSTPSTPPATSSAASTGGRPCSPSRSTGASRSRWSRPRRWGGAGGRSAATAPGRPCSTCGPPDTAPRLQRKRRSGSAAGSARSWPAHSPGSASSW